jgi:hypothetical protein
MLTWGDGVSNVNLHRLNEFHRSHGKLATVTAVRPPARFGRLEIQWDQVVEFSEKSQFGESWINGAFFVLEPGIFDYIEGDDTQWEREPMERLAKNGQLMAYCHEGFWQCMDTLRDKRLLNDLWERAGIPHGRCGSERMKVLVTGHNGYIGSILVPMLHTAGPEVVGLDSYLFHDCTFGTAPPDIPSLRLDIRDVQVEHLEGFDAIVHLAALSNDRM